MIEDNETWHKSYKNNSNNNAALNQITKFQANNCVSTVFVPSLYIKSNPCYHHIRESFSQCKRHKTFFEIGVPRRKKSPKSTTPNKRAAVDGTLYGCITLHQSRQRRY